MAKIPADVLFYVRKLFFTSEGHSAIAAKDGKR